MKFTANPTAELNAFSVFCAAHPSLSLTEALAHFHEATLQDIPSYSNRDDIILSEIKLGASFASQHQFDPVVQDPEAAINKLISSAKQNNVLFEYRLYHIKDPAVTKTTQKFSVQHKKKTTVTIEIYFPTPWESAYAVYSTTHLRSLIIGFYLAYKSNGFSVSLSLEDVAGINNSLLKYILHSPFIQGYFFPPQLIALSMFSNSNNLPLQEVIKNLLKHSAIPLFTPHLEFVTSNSNLLDAIN